jgi:hypothetical protein
VVKVAERDGMSPAAIRAVLFGDEAAMPPDTALGFRFAKSVLHRDIATSDFSKTGGRRPYPNV